MRRLGLVLVVGLLAVPCARADSGGTVRARLVAEVDAGLAAADRRWVWQGWYQDYQGTPGWDPASGGIWWNTQQTVKAAESVNTAALLAVELYEAHTGASYLAAAERLIGWADQNQPPQFDAMYLRYLIDAYQISDDPRLYAVASENASRIERNAVDDDGYYLKAWNGGMDGVSPGLISVDGAALEVLAWTAAATSDS